MHQTKQFKCWHFTQILRAFCLVMLVTAASFGDAFCINANLHCSTFLQDKDEVETPVTCGRGEKGTLVKVNLCHVIVMPSIPTKENNISNFIFTKSPLLFIH